MSTTTQHLLERGLELAGSVKFAIGLVIAISLACLAGTVIPQGNEVAGYLQQNPLASGRVEWWSRMGLTHLYSAWWFMAMLAVLLVSMTACSIRQFRRSEPFTGVARRRVVGSILTHVSVLLILAGSMIRGVVSGRSENEFGSVELPAVAGSGTSGWFRHAGVPVVYAGFVLMIVGLAIVFFVSRWAPKHGVPLK